MSILKQNCPVALCSDHAGYDTKEAVKAYLESEGIAYKDFGTYSTDSCDYPDFAHPCAEAVEKGGIRAALCWIPEVAALSRQHNDANVLAMPGRFVSNEQAIEMVKTFLNTDFEGGRHIRRIEKIPVK